MGTTFAERFAELLRETGMTKYRLSRQTGISQTTLGRWEAGTQQPGIGAASLLAEVFGVSAAYLMGKSDERTPPRADVTEEDIKFALFQGADHITDEMYNEVLDFARFVREKYGKGGSCKD